MKDIEDLTDEELKQEYGICLREMQQRGLLNEDT